MDSKVYFIISSLVDEKGSDVKVEPEDVDAVTLVNDIVTRNRGLAGGYLIETNGRLWNAFVDEETNSVRYCVDDLSMAQNMLRAVVEFGESGQHVEFFFWEYSRAELDKVGDDQVSLIDHGIVPENEQPVFPKIIIDRTMLIKGFCKATESYINLTRRVIEESTRALPHISDRRVAEQLGKALNALEVHVWRNLLTRLKNL